MAVGFIINEIHISKHLYVELKHKTTETVIA